MIDQYSRLDAVQILDPVTLTASSNGDRSVDLQGYESCLLAALVGLSGDTLSASNTIELEVEHADDDGAGNPDVWEDCEDADLLNVVAATNPGTFALVDDPAEDDAVYLTGYIGGRRHVRVVSSLTGTHTNGTPVGIVALRGNARHQPV